MHIYLGGLLYIQTVSLKSVSAVLMLEACYIHEPLHPLINQAGFARPVTELIDWLFLTSIVNLLLHVLKVYSTCLCQDTSHLLEFKVIRN